MRSSAANVIRDRPAATLPAASRGRRPRAVPARLAALSARSERRLIRDAQRGSSEALEVFFRRHWSGAYRAAWLVVRDTDTAEDIAQEAFLAAMRALDRFDRRRPFGPWFHRIVVNRAIDAARSRALRREVDAAAAEDTAADPPPEPLSDVDTGRRLWVRHSGDRPRALAWTRDGKRLVVLSARGLHVYDRRGRALLTKRLPGAEALALHPSGLRAAVAVAGRGGTSVLTVRLGPAGRPRPVVAGLGQVDGVAWSPDGRRLLVASRDTDQWLLVGPRRRVRPLSGVSGELGAGAGFPRLAGWCCPGG